MSEAPHQHVGSKCPVTGGYGYCPAQEGDSRSVCPALNTMANHGYIPRDGKKLSVFTLIDGLRKCYGLSLPLAIVLASGGWMLIKRFNLFRKKTSLDAFDKHGGVEHDASLVHRDCLPGQNYAPTQIVEPWVPELLEDIRPRPEGEEGLMNEEDVARARVRREKLSPPLDAVHAEIARGEMAIILGCWEHRAENKSGAPLSFLLPWFRNERLPDGWKPDHVQTLRDVMRRSKIMRKTMEKMRAEEKVQEKKE